MNKIAISCENISKEYVLGRKYNNLRTTLSQLFKKTSRKQFLALDNINIQIEKGKTTGIIGHNGAGKSTLLKILSRITPPTYGNAIIEGKLASLLEVGTGFHPELTGIENIYLNGSLLGMTRKEIKNKIDNIIDFSEIGEFINTPVKFYSSGMYVRLAFSVAANLEADILLIDEVLAVGDQAFQKKCLSIMDTTTTSDKTVILVSHNMSHISKVCDRVILLQNGKIKADGLPNYVINKYLEANNESKVLNESILEVSSPSIYNHNNVIVQCGAPLEFKIFIDEIIVNPFNIKIEFLDLYGTVLSITNTRFHFDNIGNKMDNVYTCTIPKFSLNVGNYKIVIKIVDTVFRTTIDSREFNLTVDKGVFFTRSFLPYSHIKFLMEHTWKKSKKL